MSLARADRADVYRHRSGGRQQLLRQPLLDTIARNFSLSASSAGLLLPPRSWAMPQVCCFLFPSGYV